MLLFIIKINNEYYELYKRNVNLDLLRNDVKWAAEDLLLEETSLRNYIKASRELDSLRITCSAQLFGKMIISENIFSEELDEVVYQIWKRKFDPSNSWDDLKILTVESKAELEVRNFLDALNFTYEVILL